MKYFCIKYLFIILLGCLIFQSCDDQNEPPKPNDENIYGISDDAECSILLYAVASNNLAKALVGPNGDLKEIINIAQSMDLKKQAIWTYYLTNDSIPRLYKLVRDSKSDSIYFKAIINYSRQQFSTDPQRISKVIEDYKNLQPSNSRGIIFWSHGSGWTPTFSTHKIDSQKSSIKRSFGWDAYNGQIDQCDIIELSDAIPENTFDFIWFDCCYMGSIELAYQIRNKATYMVGYPTEVWSEGMPYHYTIPYILKDKPDIVGAAKEFAEYFITKNLPYTIGVYKLSEMDKLAQYSESCVSADRLSRVWLHNYGRNGIGPFYDYKEYTLGQADNYNDNWDFVGFEKALDDCIEYQSASEYDFSGRTINPNKFCGITVHYFDDLSSPESEYYKSLDWFKKVYTTIPEY